MKKEYIKQEKRIAAINIFAMQFIIEKNGVEEKIVKYDESEIIKEYLYKEKELIHFIKLYIDEMVITISNIEEIYPRETRPIQIPNPNDKISYYFDSFITQFSTMIELNQKDFLERYFRKIKDNNIFPSRNEYGLWWQIYMLRNRIVHYTEKRYSTSKENCICYQNFSSRCNIILIDEQENISMETTLIDIHKHEKIQAVIETSINSEDKQNPFDILFPNKSAKGKYRKRPIINVIAQDIWFDYASSGFDLINEIYNFLNNINEVFFNYYYENIENKKKLLDCKFLYIINNEEETITIKELYNQ